MRSTQASQKGNVKPLLQLPSPNCASVCIASQRVGWREKHSWLVQFAFYRYQCPFSTCNQPCTMRVLNHGSNLLASFANTVVIVDR